MKLLFFVITNIFFINLILQQIQSQRRITDGTALNKSIAKKYMVYLVEATEPQLKKSYDTWLCGGAIISSRFILTAAACVEDVRYIYAIAGSIKYVPSEKINEDKCAQEMKKKVVFVCVPKEYVLNHENVTTWSFIDIAAVRVETPYDFTKPPSEYCSWTPNEIEMSFESKHASSETDTLILGWGNNRTWRKPNEIRDPNEEILQYSRTQIIDKNTCKLSYANITGFSNIIDKYMICTDGEGNIDASGRLKNPEVDLVENGCIKNKDKCETQMSLPPLSFYGFKRRKFPSINETELPKGHTRRNGICQNDHGGPLITWVGGHEFLIGVASVFLVDALDNACSGPYLFTSTYCNGAFLNCIQEMILDDNKKSKEKTERQESRRFMTPEMIEEQKIRDATNERYKMMVMMNSGHCDLPAEERGFDMIQRRISWMHHPDGPAENELPEELIERPQEPISNLH